MILEAFEETLQHLLDACKKVYGRDLITLAVFGSVARGTPNPNSDIDIMLVIKNLPSGRMKRMQQFDEVEKMMEPWISSLKKYQIYTMLSPVIKTPKEVETGSLLFLDMIEDARILYDRDDFFAIFLNNFAKKLKNMGAFKVSNGEKWHWVIKPDYKQGEVFDI